MRRRLLIASNNSGIPMEFTRVSYIQKNGNTQYIDTGVIAKPKWTYGFDFERLGKFNYLCGADTGWNGAGFNISIDLSESNGLRVLSFDYEGTLNKSYVIPEINKRILIIKSPTTFQVGDKKVSLVNGTTYNKWNLTIFTTNRNKVPQVDPVFEQNYRLYRFWIEDADGNYIRNMLPCKDKENKPCMYDTVSQQAFYNAGTGEFIAGGEI